MSDFMGTFSSKTEPRFGGTLELARADMVLYHRSDCANARSVYYLVLSSYIIIRNMTVDRYKQICSLYNSARQDVRRLACYLSTMAMATAVANKDKSLMDHLAAAKSALVTAEMHGQVLAATFPDTFLAGDGTTVVGRWDGPARDLLPNTSVPFS